MSKRDIDTNDLERLQRTTRVDEETDSLAKLIAVPLSPTSATFSINTGPGISLVDIPADTETRFDFIYIEFCGADIATGYTANPLQLIADGNVIGNIHTGFRAKTPGTRKFQIFNPFNGLSFIVKGFLGRLLEYDIRSPVVYGFDVAGSGNYRPLSITGQGELVTAITGSSQNVSSPLNLNSKMVWNAGSLAGNAVVVNQNVVGGAVGREQILKAIYLAADGVYAGGEEIHAEWRFSGPTTQIFRLTIKTGLNDYACIDFGDSGPVSNTSANLQVSIIKPFAIGDGWKVGAITRSLS